MPSLTFMATLPLVTRDFIQDIHLVENLSFSGFEIGVAILPYHKPSQNLSSR
jgi:hypothetical protein